MIKNSVSSEIRLKILESARLTGSSLNTQPWRFIVIQNKDNLLKLSMIGLAENGFPGLISQ